jgi:hypothetical protein
MMLTQNATPVRVPVLDTGVKLLARGLRDTGDFVYRYANMSTFQPGFVSSCFHQAL